MPDFEEQASIHPRTVTEFSQGDIVGPKRERVRSSRSVADNTYVKVHPEVWRLAVKAANNEPWRIEIISETEVYVHNNRDWRSRE